MVVRRLTKEQMSEFNCTIICCRNIPTEQTALLLQLHRSMIQNSCPSPVLQGLYLFDEHPVERKTNKRRKFQFEANFYPSIAEGRNLRDMFRLIIIKPSSGLGHKHKHKK
jgi:hypothetical protein